MYTGTGYHQKLSFVLRPAGKSVPCFDAILKHDLARGTVEAFELGPGRFQGAHLRNQVGGRGTGPAAPGSQGSPGRRRRGAGSRLRALLLRPLEPEGAARRYTPLVRRSLRSWVPAVRGVGGGQDDDGYILVHVWDEEQQRSELLIIDAQDMGTSEPLARVILPCRVPFGFHGIYIPSESLAK